MAAPEARSGAAASGWPHGLPPAFPDLLAVVADTPAAFSAAAAAGPFSKYPCHLAPLHLAAALGREKCVQALLRAGASPWLWTRPPPSAPRAAESDDDDGAESGGEGEYAGYESVCGSSVYQALKQQLPNSSPFPYTFTLAQLLLRTPCSPLVLAVRFGQQAAARALLAAMHARGGGRDAPGDADSNTAGSSPSSSASSRCSSPDGGASPADGSAAALAQQLDAALAVWPAASEPALLLLRRLLAAGGGADPLRRLLPAVLARYQNCSTVSSMAEHLRQGLREVLQHVLPAEEGSPGGSGSDDEGRPEEGSELGAGGRLRWRAGRPPPHTAALHQLLHAAAACRDSPRGAAVLAALQAGGGSPWRDAAANCALLAAAAAHDCAGVVQALLALPPAPGSGLPPFNPDMWGPDGHSALMAAAHRGALGALAALLAAGATLNLADEMGASALHWAVAGGQQDAVVMLAQAGAAVDLAGGAHEEEEHLERPLLTASMRCDAGMLRLLRALGASLDAPAPSGATPLSVAVCWERLPAVRLLLELGADPNQVLPPHVAGGAYPMWSDSYSAEEAFTLLGMACSRCDYADIVGALLESGADPSLRHPLTGLTPAAEAASYGAVDEAAELIERTAVPRGAWTLEQLGWADAVAQAVGTFLWHHVPSPAEALQPLLDAWRRQPGPPAAPPRRACNAIVAALLSHPALQLADGAAALQSGAELAGVLQAEALASIGVAADLTPLLRQPGNECLRYVVLAAAPAATRWSPATHRHFPPAFKHTVRALLLAVHRLGAGGCASGCGGGPAAGPAAGGSGGALPGQRGQLSAEEEEEEEEGRGGQGPAPLAADATDEDGGSGDERPPQLAEDESDEDCWGVGRAGAGAALGPATPPAAEPAPSEPGGGGGAPQRRVPKVASTAELGGPAVAGACKRDAAAGEARAGAGGSTPAAAASSLESAAATSPEPAVRGSGQCGVRAGANQSSAGEEGAAGTAVSSAAAPARSASPAEGGQAGQCQAGPLRLPRDAVHEIVRLLGSEPLSHWMSAPAPPGRAAEGGSTPAAAPHLLSFV